jgi:ubiquinone/menaquinone biosynthesis C-methylase UbiE
LSANRNVKLSSARDPIAIQREYYRQTAECYDYAHLEGSREHNVALRFMIAMMPLLECRSVLDVGSGTGRALLAIKEHLPQIRICGIEPSPELRAQALDKGLASDEIVAGDAQVLSYRDGEFDLVCAFGALHHIAKPSLAVSEMLRVSRRAIFISDANSFGQGSAPVRAVKQFANLLGLWPLLDFIKTGGKGYRISEGDGLSYSYSVFTDYKQIRRACAAVHILNTLGTMSRNPYRGAPHVALLGIK